MKNAEWMLKNGMEFSKLYWEYSNGKNVVYYLDGNVYKKVYSEECTIAKNIILKWLDLEHEEPILTDAEKQYLSAFIKPFRDRVMGIGKLNYNGSTESKYQYVFIVLSDFSYDMTLPVFEKETMYKGMKLDRVYSIKELGL